MSVSPPSRQPAGPWASRFVAVFAAVSLGLVLLTLLLIWRGDQVGVQVAQLEPRPGASDAASATRLKLTFAEPVVQDTVQVELDPPVSGRLDWLDARTALWVPQPSLAPDTRYTATVKPGLRSQLGRAMRAPLVWSFRTRPLRVVYLSEKDDKSPNLWTVGLNGSPPQRLTAEPNGTLEFTVAPDGSEVAYNTYNPNGYADLRAVNIADGSVRKLYEDNGARAGLMAWSPAGDVIAWERSALTQSSAQTGLPVVGQPRIWLLTADGKPIGPAGRQDGVYFRPVWAPDGTRLAFVDGANSAVVVFNFTEITTSIPTDTDGILSWSPDGQFILIGSLSEDSPPRQRIVRVSVSNGATATLTPDESRIHDNNAAYSPDGRRIGFIRSVDGFARSHLWVMDADGQNARALTNDPQYKDVAVIWSPDGQTILFGRYPTQGGSSGPELWLADPHTGQIRSLGINGLLAAWLP